MSKKILIIEDDPIAQKALQDFLLTEDFEVITAINGEEGVNLAKNNNPDLILLDIILPKKDGYEVIKELKLDNRTKEIPIIFLTNLGSLNDVEKALALGVTNYLVKSDYKMKEVVQKIKSVLKMDSEK